MFKNTILGLSQCKSGLLGDPNSQINNQMNRGATIKKEHPFCRAGVALPGSSPHDITTSAPNRSQRLPKPAPCRYFESITTPDWRSDTRPSKKLLSFVKYIRKQQPVAHQPHEPILQTGTQLRQKCCAYWWVVIGFFLHLSNRVLAGMSLEVL